MPCRCRSWRNFVPKGIFDKKFTRVIAFTVVFGVRMAAIAVVAKPLGTIVAVALSLTAYAAGLWLTGVLDKNQVDVILAAVMRRTRHSSWRLRIRELMIRDASAAKMLLIEYVAGTRPRSRERSATSQPVQTAPSPIFRKYRAVRRTLSAALRFEASTIAGHH